MFAVVVLAAMLANDEGAATPLPADIPSDAVFYTQEDARKMHMEDGYYPPKAANAHASGAVTIECEVGADGKLIRCAVLDETPPDLGFGKATAVLFLKHAKITPEQPDTPLPASSWKKFRYIWKYDGRNG
ncbi:MAG: TonB family protein [Asticcacaulis sp.]|uniref:TonB family protein n=1 Tax=Asticcacaulis sp. TaxID=1872648 RepID=UPI0039E628EC